MSSNNDNASNEIQMNDAEPPAPPQPPPAPPLGPQPSPPDPPPIEPPSPPSPGCFLTTAVVDAMGMADDSEPLTMVRALRDREMGSAREIESVALYYKVAPLIVARTSNEQWTEFWRDHMKPITNLIKHGQYEIAKDWYTYATARLIDERATRFGDVAEVDEVYAYGLRGFARSVLPYPVRYALLKFALRVEVARRGLRLAFRKRAVARIIRP